MAVVLVLASSNTRNACVPISMHKEHHIFVQLFSQILSVSRCTSKRSRPNNSCLDRVILATVSNLIASTVRSGFRTNGSPDLIRPFTHNGAGRRTWPGRGLRNQPGQFRSSETTRRYFFLYIRAHGSCLRSDQR